MMKEYIKNIVTESLADEVEVDREWRHFSASRAGWRSAWLILRYAAAVIVGVVISLAAPHIAGREHWAGGGLCKLVTLKGEKTHLQLPDGTKIWINSCTTIEYAENYGRDNRDIYLCGEAYFEVAENCKLPFVVKTNGMNVTALGTEFNICAYRDESRLETTLFNGKVVVEPTLTRQQITLSSNQVAVYSRADNKIEVMPYDKNVFAQWRGEYIMFDTMYLQDITRLLERIYDVVFTYDNQKIKNLRFSGSFRNGEELTHVLDVIRTNTGIKYQMARDTIIIK